MENGMDTSQTITEQPFVAITVPPLELFGDGEAARGRSMPETTP
jgi:hypothetical protein